MEHITPCSSLATHSGLPLASYFGRFRVLENIAHDHNGSVYAAYDPQLDRRIALKVLHNVRAHAPAKEEFTHEARALAKLSHPNLVAVHEVGEHDGAWFAAMEFVEGKTLPQWLDLGAGAKRTREDTVRVLLQAGAGLAAAHAAGIVHRNFRPESVIVDDDGRARVVSFRLSRDTQHSENAAEGPSIGVTHADASSTATPPADPVGARAEATAYTAPEQLCEERENERTDQYSFCIVAWEALYGALPFEAAGTADRLDLISKEVGAAPSEAGTKDSLRAILRKGLALAPSNRHASLRALLDELGAAIETTPSAGRKRWSALAAAAFVTFGVGAWAVQSRQAAEQLCSGATKQLANIWNDDRRSAVHDAIVDTKLPYASEVWNRTRDELDNYRAAWTTMYTENCEATSVKHEQPPEVMDLRMTCLARAKQDLDAAVAVLSSADSDVVENTHRLTSGLRPLAICADVDALKSGFEPPKANEKEIVERGQQLLAESNAERGAGRYQASADKLDMARELLSKVEYSPIKLDFALEQSEVTNALGQYADATSAAREAITLATEQNNHAALQRAATDLVFLLGTKGQKLDEAKRFYGLAMRLALPDTRERAQAHAALGAALYEHGQNDKAKPEFIHAISIANNLTPPDHLLTARLRMQYSGVLRVQTKLDEAETENRAALDILTTRLGEDHPALAEPQGNLGNLLTALGRLEEGEHALRGALQLVERPLGGEHPRVAKWLNGLANNLRLQKRYKEAEPFIVRALHIEEKLLGPNKASVAYTCITLGYLLADDTRFAEAEPYFVRAQNILETAFSPSHPVLAHVHSGLATVYLELGKYEFAHTAAEQALSIFAATAPSGTDSSGAKFALAKAKWELGTQRRDAVVLARTALAELEAAPNELPEVDIVSIREWLTAHGEPGRG